MKDLYVVLKRTGETTFHESFVDALKAATNRIETHHPGVEFYVFKCLGVAQMPKGPTFTPISSLRTNRNNRIY